MTLKICGMTLDEIEAKFKEFDKEKRKQEVAYKAGKLPRRPSMPNFTPDEAYDFTNEIFESVDKAMKEVESRIENADEKQKGELSTIGKRLSEIWSKCFEISNQHPSF